MSIGPQSGGRRKEPVMTQKSATGVRQRPRNASRPARRRERLEARISPEQKALLERAAALEGRSLTDFVVASAQAAAQETIERHEIIGLTARDSLVFAAALMRPPAPNDRLREAARRHHDLIAE
jgi:uncharacterized protein (DUF1778 family)